MDNQQNKEGDFLSCVVQVLAESEPQTMVSYALGSFMEMARRYGLDTVNVESLRLWIALLYIKGMKAKTVQRYVGKLHTIYKACAKGNSDAVDPFLNLQPCFDASYEVHDDEVRFNVDVMRRLFGKDEASNEWSSVAIFFYLLYNADATLLDMADATFDNAPDYCSQVVEIVRSRDRSKGQKYLFKLGQKQVRPAQIFRKVTEDLTAVLTAAGMKSLQGSVREEITAMWVCLALQCGVDVCDIRAIIPAVPYQYRALLLIRKPEISEVRLHAAICRVADAVNDNTPRWFVMKMRKGVEHDQVTEKIETELPGRLNTMELFYPTHTAFRMKGGRKIKKEIPFVPDILFFRTQYNKVRSLFAKIGDIAWCMKTNNVPEARYSVISQEEMSGFQKCVGQFTDDIRIDLVNANRGLGKGRMVRVTAGVMKGYVGKIEDINDDKGTRTFFLQISNDQALRWTAEVDEAFIEPLDK